MSAREEAQRFLDQLRTQNQAALGSVLMSADQAAEIDSRLNRFIHGILTAEERQDPQVQSILEKYTARSIFDVDDMMTQLLTQMQENIEKTAAGRITGIDLSSLRPLVGHLQTGQLNAVSMRVPGPTGAYLVLFEDQMPLFASLLSQSVAWAIPHDPPDADGNVPFRMSVPDVTGRIESDPRVPGRFADIVVSYAVRGKLVPAEHHVLPPHYLNLASMVRDSLEYFVLGHEYAHILLGHLDTTAARKGVLPAGEAETLAYSWQQEVDADQFGMALSINACLEHENYGVSIGFLGAALFFDALDVMDRAVALLQTGDENTRQIGSHPPSDLRKQHLCKFLPEMAEDTPAGARKMRAAIEAAEMQQKIVHLLWEHTRPILLKLHRRGVPAARTWRTIAKETGNELAAAPQTAPAPKRARRRGLRWRRRG